MDKLFGWLALVVLLFSGWVAHKNKQAYQEQADSRKKAESTFTNKLATKERREKTLAKLESSIEDATTQVASANQKLAEAQESLAALQESVGAKQKERDPLAMKLKEVKDYLAKLPEPDEVVPQIKKLKLQIIGLEEEVEIAESKLANVLQQGADSEEKIEKFEMVAKNRSALRSQSFLSTRLAAVYQEWGFVTLGAGDLQGVVPGSTLDVLRNGEIIAKLAVTAVELNSAAADIIRSSIDQGVVLQAGDQVRAESVDGTAGAELN